MVVELSAQPTQNIAMETRCRHSVVQAQRDLSTGKAQCRASDTETRLALRRGSTLNGAGLFSCPTSAWPVEELWEWANYVNRLRYATLAHLSTQGPMNA